MPTIGPEVNALQLTGAKANVGLRAAFNRLMGGDVTNNNRPKINPEGVKGPLKPAGQVSTENLIRGWKDPDVTVQPALLPIVGYTPSWRFKAPIGIGRPAQHVYTAYSLIPNSATPGDFPNDYLRSYQPPMVQNFAMRQQGIPTQGGNLLLTGLYTPSPINPPVNP